MNISTKDVNWLVDELAEQLEAGYKWSVLEYGASGQKFEHVHLYYDSDQAERYCNSIRGTDIKVRLVETSILQQLMETISNSDKKRNDVDYYEIDLSSFAVSRVLKTNPDQNPLHNPDGNWFTEELISHIEKHNKSNTSGEFSVLAANFILLRSQLNRQGFDSDFFLTLEASMSRGAAKHKERYFSQYDTETVMYDHLFTRNSEGYYSLDKITGTLYSPKDIDHASINGINTKELENKVLFIDSNKDGLTILREYGPIFQQLCDDPSGRVIAVQMFNNNVPFWWDKPDFISRIEDELNIYPKVNFPGETTRIQVYEGLKSYQEISIALRQYEIPDTRDEKSKAALIEKLVKGESCSLNPPIGVTHNNEVKVYWDMESKKLSFVLDGVYAEGYYLKQPSDLFNSILKELEQYPIRQLGHPFKEQLLVDGIIDGKRIPVHLEKEIVPDEHIDRYVLIEVSQTLKPIEIKSSPYFDGAFYEMNQLGEEFSNDKSKGNSTLFMVGLFKGKCLQLYNDGVPTTQTGYLVASAKEFSRETGFVVWLANADRTNILVDQIFVEKDAISNRLIFSDRDGKPLEIDKEFWTRADQPGWDKKQSEVEVDLIPKLRVDGDKKGKTL